MESPQGARPRLLIIVGSTRPGRVGLPVARWFETRVAQHGAFEPVFADLAEIDLPLMDEPNHPRLRAYTKPHTIAWSELVDGCDAIVFVTPEYNHSFSAPLKNAIDYLSQEWAFKPLGLISYGGFAGGVRAVAALKPIAAQLKMVPLPESVTIPGIAQLISDEGEFTPTDSIERSANAMLDELRKWTDVLRALRTPATK
jgi:NAD(P)H-dependent FMN reductase